MFFQQWAPETLICWNHVWLGKYFVWEGPPRGMREMKRKRKRGRSKGYWVTGGKVEPSEKHVKVKVAQSCLNLCDPHGLYSSWNSPYQNTGVGSLSLLQGIFSTQGSNLGLPHCRQILYQLSHKGRPRILEWVAYPFSSGSSQPRNRTGVSCISGRFFTNWVIREAEKHNQWYVPNGKGSDSII